MALRPTKVVVGLLLMLSGTLLYAAARERWAGICPWGGDESSACLAR